MDQQLLPYSQFEATLGRLNLALSGFFMRLNDTTVPGALTLQRAGLPTPTHTTAFLYPISSVGEGVEGTLAFLLEEQELQKLLQTYFFGIEAQLFIYNPNLNTVYVPPNASGGDAKALLTARGRGLHTIKREGTSYILLRIFSTQSGYTYIAAVPQADVYRDSRQQLFRLVGLQLLLLSVSTITALALAKSHLVQLQAAESLNSEMSATIDNQSLALQRLVLQKLLTEEAGSLGQPEQSLDCAGLSFPFGYYTVVVAMLPPGRVDSGRYEQLEALPAQLNGIGVRCYSLQLPEQNQVAYILNLENWDKRMAVLHSLLQLETDHFPGVVFGCGLCCESYQELSSTYIQAVVAANGQMYPLGPGFYRFKKQKPVRDSIQYPMAEEAMLQESIRQGHPEVAAIALADIYESIRSSFFSKAVVRCMQVNVINLLAKTAAAIGQPISGEEMDELFSCRMSQELERRLLQLAQRLSACAEQQNKQQTMDAHNNIFRYVQEHFANHQLSLIMVAQQFHLSVNYISKIFKDETGETFLSYVTRLRFAYIKLQLAETDVPIKDIVQQAGYLDAPSFMRKFKQAEGMTLGEYRNRYRQR